MTKEELKKEAEEIIKSLLTHNLKMHNYVMYNLDEDVIKQAEAFLNRVNGF